MIIDEIRADLKVFQKPEKVPFLLKYFKVVYNDEIFLGVSVPSLRKIAFKYSYIDFQTLNLLINSNVHEERFLALLFLIKIYQRGSADQKTEVFNFYIKNIDKVNNWDLVDLSAPKILGNYLLDKSSEILYQLASSSNFWRRRIAIVSTLEFIRNNKFENTLNLSKILLTDSEDLIHKAVGWMLREVGKKNLSVLLSFLDQNHKQMPRIMLRYAIEKLSSDLKNKYLAK